MKNKQKKPSIQQAQHIQDKQKKPPIPKPEITESIIADYLEKEFGNISATAKRLGVDRNTIYSRIDKSEFLKGLLKTVRYTVDDMVETNIYKMIAYTLPENPTPAQVSMHKFYASSRLKDKGFTTTQQIEMKADINANVNGQLDLTYMTIEEKQKVLNQLKESDEILNSLKDE